MVSKRPSSKLDHETRTKRQKALESRREPQCRPKTHWDHVLEEMVWLSKDFESERKWKLNLAKKVALKASKGMLDQSTKGERKLKEEEQRLRKVALNISKDVKKFWVKIEKLVLYKHQMELDEKKKKVQDKQLEFLLGQTERYSTMLAENLMDTCKAVQHDRFSIQRKGEDEKIEDESRGYVGEPESENIEIDDDYGVLSEDESEDDEHTMEEDEALITEEERREELEALRNEVDLPLEELLQRYSREKEVGVEQSAAEDETALMKENHDGGEVRPVKSGDEDQTTIMNVNNGENSNLLTGRENGSNDLIVVIDRRCSENNDQQSLSENHMLETSKIKNLSELEASKFQNEHAVYDFSDEHDDGDFILGGEEKDDETTLLEEEELAKGDQNSPMDEIALLQKESEIPLEELLSRYKKDSSNGEDANEESEYDSTLSEHLEDSLSYTNIEQLHLDSCTQASDKAGEFQPFTHSSAEREGSLTRLEDKESENRIADAAAAARSAQPTGNTFSTTQVRTKFPFLLKHPLREYQHIGLDWLVTMYEKRLNGILADEMGLGKTIMTISMLAHLACEKGIWGPHLIVVPTSVMLNWETEFLKWCPAFKILTYFGSAKERKFKRQGWMKLNSFHVCITTYRLVIQDSKVFKRKKWKYLILDEAHLIKNWKSQRWQTLLNFNSKRRILLTGTPLQNDLMELWSLMHFLMPHVFQSHQEFKDWFSNPITGMVEGQEKVNKEVVDRLHNVLRPFILRRLKRDVEKQLPMKHEHIINCRLSRRQRNLYEDFIASSETQATLASANFFGMIGVIMQLRKVCNHPDLFEGRPIISSFDMSGIHVQLSSSVCTVSSRDPFSTVDLNCMGLSFTHLDFEMTSWESDEIKAICTPSSLIRAQGDLCIFKKSGPRSYEKDLRGINIFEEIQKALMEERVREAKERAEAIAWWNSLRCNRKPIYSTSLRELVTICHPVYDFHSEKAKSLSFLHSSTLANMILSPVERLQKMMNLVESFMFAIPAARAPPPECWFSGSGSNVLLHPSFKQKCSQSFSPLLTPVRPAIVRRQVYFPDRRLIQFDCGKLQELASLLRKLKAGGHRALIFTQMTKMLDILEFFISLYGYTYMRLDGSTQPEDRQTLMQRFNTNPKLFLFILSTRSGGVGINLVGADTVIFYDSDWNPAMDQQAQDRCHRIGQTREVHIYRLISESTIEENILKKANQKRALDNLVIQSGDYNTDFFKKLDPMELFSDHRTQSIKNTQKEEILNDRKEVTVSNADVETALKLAEDEADYMALKKVEEEEAVDNQEFTEEPIGRIEDDEFMNDDEMKIEEPGDQGSLVISSNLENVVTSTSNDPCEERVLHIPTEEDVDMLADVKQMAAAAAAAGQAISSFEKQLRPIDQYAIRFLELWDPIIDKRATESQVSFEETEWELDRIEKYKEEMEAEIDEDEEPLVYEKWDADYATEAYRQQVEALAQHMLMEELESEAKDAEGLDENCDSTRDVIGSEPKVKSKKKTKKAKFKSLKKRSLSSDLKHVKQESSSEPMLLDDDDFYDEDGIHSEMTSPRYLQKKRKKVEFNLGSDEEKTLKKKAKKFGRNPSKIFSLDLDSGMLPDETMESKSCENVVSFEQKPVGRSRTGGKISITTMPVKRVLTIKPEKIKRGNVWSRDCVPLPDFWLPQEDAVICAVVHEYGTCWSLVSETLYGMTAGGFYRGRYRHPVHCCERYRELIQKYILSVADHPNIDKIANSGSGKALLKVTEENLRSLLDIAAEMPNHEYLLQKHFTALLAAVWKRTSQDKYQQKLSSTRTGLFSGNSVSTSGNRISQILTRERMKFTNLEHSGKSLAAALHDVNSFTRQDDKTSCSGRRENASITAGYLELSLELPVEKDDNSLPLPSVINLSVFEPERSPCEDMAITDHHHLKSSQNVAENRFRITARACMEGSIEWALTVFPTNDLRSRWASKSPALGKHKPATSDVNRPGKSKLRKLSTDEPETFNLNAEPLFQHGHSIGTKDLDEMFTTKSPMIMEFEINDSDFSFGTVEQPSLGIETFEAASHVYTPEVISGLDDCLTFREFVDIW